MKLIQWYLPALSQAEPEDPVYYVDDGQTYDVML